MYFIRKACVDDDLDTIVKLMIKGFTVFDYDTFVKEKADNNYNRMKDLFCNENTLFSYRNMWLCLSDDSSIAGIMIAVNPEKIDNTKSLKEVMQYGDMGKKHYKQFIEKIKPLINKNGSIYLEMIAVEDGHDETVIGPMLLDELYIQTKKENCTCVYTDVRSDLTHHIDLLKEAGFSPLRALERNVYDNNHMCIRMSRWL